MLFNITKNININTKRDSIEFIINDDIAHNVKAVLNLIDTLNLEK